MIEIALVEAVAKIKRAERDKPVAPDYKSIKSRTRSIF
jgi:hypothetical protein